MLFALAAVGAFATALVVVSETPRASAPSLVRAARRMMNLSGHTVQFGPPLGARRSATGPLRVSRQNPRYFADPSGRPIILAGDHTWYTMQDSGVTDPPVAFDYQRFLDFLESNGINFFRTFVWEQAKWSVGVTGEYFYSPSIFERTGPGSAIDGKPRFDLTRFNEQYFSRLRERVMAAGERGIYVSLQLFQGFSVSRKPFMAAQNPWPGHPFHVANNINGINGDPNGNGEGEETETLEVPAITSLQKAYLRKVIDVLGDLDNVLFEICNEAHSTSNAWHEELIQYIHSYEATRPKQHPVGRTVNWPSGSNAELYASSADWISPNADGGYYDDPPAADGRKVIISDTDHLCYPCGSRAWMWKSVLRGLNPAFMDPYDCTADWSPGGCDPNDRTWVSLRQNLGHAVAFAERIDLAAMTPRPDLASTRYCLAGTGARGPEYLVYLPSGGSVDLNIAPCSCDLRAEWFNPDSGITMDAGAVPPGGIRSLAAPFSGDALLYIHAPAAPPRGKAGHGRGRTR